MINESLNSSEIFKVILFKQISNIQITQRNQINIFVLVKSMIKKNCFETEFSSQTAV